jgi:hypothetical protein
MRRMRVAGVLVVSAAIAAALGHQLAASSSSTAASPIDVLRSELRGVRGEADRGVPDGTTPPHRPDASPTRDPSSGQHARHRNRCQAIIAIGENA